MTVLTALNTITIDQTKATETTIGCSLQELDYLVSNQEAKVRFHVSDMITNIHYHVSYLSALGARSWVCRHFFMGWMPKNKEPIMLNGAFHTISTVMVVMGFGVASATEAELGALLHNRQTGMIFLTYASRPWPPPTKHSNTLWWSCNGRGNSK